MSTAYSTFVLLHQDLAHLHGDTLVQAAEMGDFWGWGELSAQTLFQGLACLMKEQRASGTDPQECYLQCFAVTQGLLTDRRAVEDSGEGLAALAKCIARIEGGQISRTVFSPISFTTQLGVSPNLISKQR